MTIPRSVERHWSSQHCVQSLLCLLVTVFHDVWNRTKIVSSSFPMNLFLWSTVWRWLTISGLGSDSHITLTWNAILGESMLIICTSECILPNVSSTRLDSFSMCQGTCPVELSSSNRLWMKFEMAGWRKWILVCPEVRDAVRDCTCTTRAVVQSIHCTTARTAKKNWTFFLSLSVPLSPLVDTLPSRGQNYFFSKKKPMWKKTHVKITSKQDEEIIEMSSPGRVL